MRINDVIRTRRQAVGLTQEGLAERLGVSAPAVNKWEKGINYPDITLLPALARVLGVDLNTLLSFQEDITEQEIGLFLNKVYETGGKEGVEAAFALAREKMREFPNSDLLAYSLAGLLEGLSMLELGSDEQAQEAWGLEVDALYERAAASADPRAREWACTTMAGRCISRGELERAQGLLDQLSDAHMDKPTLTARLRQKEGKAGEAWEILERDLLGKANGVQTTLLHLLELALEERDLGRARELCNAASQAGKVLGLMDYACLSCPFQLAMAEQDGPTALKLLTQMLRSLENRWDGSRLYPHLPVKEGEVESQHSLIRPVLDEVERDPDSAFLRAEPGYRELVERYGLARPV